MIRTSQSVSTVSACVEACVGNQSMISAEDHAEHRGDQPDRHQLLEVAAALLARDDLLAAHQLSDPMDAASYRSAGTEGTDRPARADAAQAARRCRAAGRAVVRRRDALRAPERLRELRRLAVADAARDLAHGHAGAGEQLGGAVHPDARELLAERRVADLGVGALELAPRRGDAARDRRRATARSRTRARRSPWRRRTGSSGAARWRVAASAREGIRARARSVGMSVLARWRYLPPASVGLCRSSLTTSAEGGLPMQVRDGMSPRVLTVGPGHTLRQAATQMAERARRRRGRHRPRRRWAPASSPSATS